MITRRALLGAGAAAAGLAACHVPRSGRATERLQREVGQLLWVGYHDPLPPASVRRRLAADRLGGVVLFRHNATDAAALRAHTDALHKAGPALVAVTQEGGRIRPLVPEIISWPPAAEILDSDAARIMGENLGQQLASLGIDVNFAPVCDVATNPLNPVIGDRSYSADPNEVIIKAGAFARGLAEGGVIPCGKHFPGHGDTSQDSHLTLPRVDHDDARLRRIELAPFAALAPHLPMIMTAHVVYPAWDPAAPATLSHRIVTGILRRELRYEGAVITDDLEMHAITMPIEDAAVAAIQAGCDALLIAHTPSLHERAAEALLRTPSLRARISESAARLRRLQKQSRR